VAYIKVHETKRKRNGKPVKRYEVIWREPVRDQFGLPVPVNPEHPDGPKRTFNRGERYDTREAAEGAARRAERRPAHDRHRGLGRAAQGG
jgi:hypothetical protein